jgi:hypothetical protein
MRPLQTGMSVGSVYGKNHAGVTSHESGRRQPHSTKLARFPKRRYFRKVLECGCPPPLCANVTRPTTLRQPKKAGMNLMIVIPSHANALIAGTCSEIIVRCSPGIRPGVFHMTIAEHHVGSSAMVLARETVAKQAIRVVTVPIIGIVIGHCYHITRRRDAAISNTLFQTNRSIKNQPTRCIQAEAFQADTCFLNADSPGVESITFIGMQRAVCSSRKAIPIIADRDFTARK